MKSIKAFWAGVKDGWRQCEDLTSGLTYDDQSLNEAYDHGANAGQCLGRLMKRGAK